MLQHTILKRVILTVLIFTGVFSKAGAQTRIYDTTTVNLMMELTKVQGYYYNTGYLSFDATYYLTDTDTITVKDTMEMKYKMNKDSMYILTVNNADTVESIQNENCNGTIYRTDSTIIVKKPTPFIKNVFQVDINDSLFKMYSLSGITVTDSLCYRIFTMSFDTGSVYKSLKMAYCADNWRMSYVMYTIKKEPSPTTTKTVYMAVKYSNYQTNDFGPSVFSTDPYFKINSTADIQLAPGMSTNYEIINLLDY